MNEPTVRVMGEIVWATGPKTDALLRRLGLSDVSRDEDRVVIGKIEKREAK